MSMITIIPDDNFVNIDGARLNFDFSTDDNYHAIHWDGVNGFIETKQGANILLTDMNEFQDIIDRHEEVKLEAEEQERARSEERDQYLNSVDRVRDERNFLISKTDWTQLPDTALSESERLAWASYRQDLRDITEGIAVYEDAVWPEAPFS